MLPPEIKKATSEIKDAPTRVLVIALIMAVIFLSGVIIKGSVSKDSKADRLEEKCEQEKLRLRIMNDSLNLAIFRKVEEEAKRTLEENARLREDSAWRESVKNRLENLIKKNKK